MLSRLNRLNLREERTRLEKEGRPRHSPLFIQIAAGSSLGEAAPPRFAILVSKKLAPLSVNRHRTRRLITEIIRHHLSEFPNGNDYLLIPKKAIFAAAPDQILADLISLQKNN